MGVLRGEETTYLHIGKSSGGWCFSLRWYRDRNLNSLCDWYRYMTKGRVTITDEYDQVISVNELLQIITHRHAKPRIFPNNFYPSEIAFMRQNHASQGPNNLLRHKENEYTRHGPGTWDLIDVEFS